MSTRHDRKEAKRKAWAEQLAIQRQKDEARERFEREHPVLSGRVRVMDYVEPYWRYVRPRPLRNQLELPDLS